MLPPEPTLGLEQRTHHPQKGETHESVDLVETPPGAPLRAAGRPGAAPVEDGSYRGSTAARPTRDVRGAGRSHAEVLVIARGSRAEAEQLAITLHAPFPVLVDAEGAVYRSNGLEKLLSWWQQSGILVVDPQGQVSYFRPTTIPAGLDEAALLQTLA